MVSMNPNIKIICLRKHNWFVCLFSKKKREEHKRWEERWGKHLTEAQEIEIIPMKYEPHEPFYLDYTYKNKENNMSEWITDRRPTAKDCVGAERMPDSNQVWVMYEGRVVACPYAYVVLGCPWQPIVVQKPEPYVKPKRFEVKWDSDLSAWMIICHYPGHYEMMCVPLNSNCDEHRKTAERIAAIYEEVMP